MKKKTIKNVPLTLTISELFEQVASENADQIAISSSCDEEITYQELNFSVTSLANFLSSKEVKAGDVIAISNDKSWLSFALMFACLKIGAVYTNIDPTSPSERLDNILKTCQPKLIFNDLGVNHHDVSSYGIETITLADINLNSFSEFELRAQLSVNGNTPAYIMFTSGSTGVPKGVTITHQNILNFFHWVANTFKPQSGDVVLNINPIYFDNSVFDIYCALLSGATLAPVRTALLQSPRHLKDRLEHAQCNIFFAVPSLYVYLQSLKLFNSKAFDSVKVFSFGGEAYPKANLKKLYDKYSDSAQFINVYGPTEGTCICSSYQVSDDDFIDMASILPLGQINPNFEYLIIDENGHVIEDDSVGELCLIGNNLSLGYYNNTEETKRAFVQRSDRQNYPELMYKTGDLVHQEPTGCLYFNGRKDFQVKHMGYRIELEEIEHVLNTCQLIEQVAVVYKKQEFLAGEIIAFIVGDEEQKDLVIQFANDSLPQYMLPKEFKYIDKLVKNSNGKIDRKALIELA